MQPFKTQNKQLQNGKIVSYTLWNGHLDWKNWFQLSSKTDIFSCSIAINFTHLMRVLLLIFGLLLEDGRMGGMPVWDIFKIMIFDVGSMMVSVEGVSETTIFARNWFSWGSSVYLNINLRVACSRHSSSLCYFILTMHLTTSACTLITGISLISCSALLKCVSTDL